MNVGQTLQCSVAVWPNNSAATRPVGAEVHVLPDDTKGKSRPLTNLWLGVRSKMD
jgi:hypothetical protein